MPLSVLCVPVAGVGIPALWLPQGGPTLQSLVSLAHAATPRFLSLMSYTAPLFKFHFIYILIDLLISLLVILFSHLIVCFLFTFPPDFCLFSSLF